VRIDAKRVRRGKSRRARHQVRRARGARLVSRQNPARPYGVESIGASHFGLFVLDPSTGTRHQIRHLTTTEARWLDLAWSPDGSRLAYVSGARGPQVGGGAIVVINADGSGRRGAPHGNG
jgi:hypothetical protein